MVCVVRMFHVKQAGVDVKFWQTMSKRELRRQVAALRAEIGADIQWKLDLLDALRGPTCVACGCEVHDGRGSHV